MRTSTPVLVVVATLLTAGCLGAEEASEPTGPADDQDPSAPGGGEALTLESCNEHFGAFTVPASQAEAYLPEGFEPVGLGGEPLPEGQATLIVLSLQCELEDADGTVAKVLLELPVDPPDEHEAEDALFHYVQVGGFSPSPRVLGAYAAWGFPRVTPGNVTLDVAIEDLPSSSGTSRASNANGTLELVTTMVGPAGPVSGGLVRIFAVEERAVTGIVDASFSSYQGGFGEADLEDDGLVPLDVAGPGAAAHAVGFDAVFAPVNGS